MSKELVPFHPLPASPTPLTVARRRARGRLLVRTFVVLAFAVPVVLFLISPESSDVDGQTQAVQAANRWAVRFTGILAGVLILLQLGLMARIPLVEDSFDRSRVVRGHAVIGSALLILVVVHVRARVEGFPYDDPPLYYQWPYQLAFVSAALLLVVALTGWSRHWLSRVRWHRLHLLAYLVLAAALPHEILRGTTSTHGGPSATVATAYWLTMVVLAYAAVFRYRIHLPARRSRRYVLVVRSWHTVLEPRDRVYDILLTSLRRVDLTGLGIIPGQYVLIYPENSRHHWLTPSSYSVSNTVTPSDDTSQQVIRLTMKVRNTDDLPRPSEVVHVAGPYGHFTCDALVNASGIRKVLFFVSGMGATPMIPMVEQLLREVDAYPDTQVTVFQRVRDESLRLFKEELDQLATSHRGRCHLKVNLLAGSAGPGRNRPWIPRHLLKGHRESQVLKDYVEGIAEYDVFLCGPRDWSRKVRRSLRELDVPRRQIHEERFG